MHDDCEYEDLKAKLDEYYNVKKLLSLKGTASILTSKVKAIPSPTIWSACDV